MKIEINVFFQLLNLYMGNYIRKKIKYDF